MRRLTCFCVTLLVFAGCGDDGGSAGETETGTTAGPVTTSMGSSGSEEASTAAESSSGGGGIDGDAIKEMADDWMNFERINVDPAASAHGNAATVNWYVPSDYAAMFRMVDPGAPAAIEMPEGTLIVKEHISGMDEFNGYTIMYKGPAGTDPDANDWWWGRVAAGGNLAENGAGMGGIGYCINCHAAAEETDYVYGVPPDNQQ